MQDVEALEHVLELRVEAVEVGAVQVVAVAPHEGHALRREAVGALVERAHHPRAAAVALGRCVAVAVGIGGSYVTVPFFIRENRGSMKENSACPFWAPLKLTQPLHLRTSTWHICFERKFSMSLSPPYSNSFNI